MTEVLFVGDCSGICSTGTKTMDYAFFATCTSVWAWNIYIFKWCTCLSTHICIVSMLPLSSTSCCHPAPPITQLYSWPMRAQASPCTADLTQSLLLSWRWDQHPKFWAGSNLSLLSGACRSHISSSRSPSPPCHSCTMIFPLGCPFLSVNMIQV